MAGWGDHEWNDPWGGTVVASPVLASAMIVAWDDPEEDELVPPIRCRRSKLPDLCSLLPAFYCIEDNDPLRGGSGDHHRFLGTIEDLLLGTKNNDGIANLVKSFLCIRDPSVTRDRFLNALLRDLGFTLELPLTTEQKRKIIPLLVPELYQRKGTVASLERAFELFLGIPVEVIPGAGDSFPSLECGEEADRSLTDVGPGDTFVRVSQPENFPVGKNLVLIDTTTPFVDFPDTPIRRVISDRVYFADADNPPPTISGTIEANAMVFADRFCDQLEADDADGGCSKLGVEEFDATEKALYGFYVDIERTVTTTTALNDGDTEVDVDSVDFIVVGSRLRITDTTSPLEPSIVKVVKAIDGLTVKFETPVNIIETIEAGAEALNVFTAEELAIIDSIVEFSKPAWTFHTLTRDKGAAEAETG